ncbi:kinase-like domain-containing protein [Lipomyces oligophaga]|uniref:kinase-like domain-containing protein n=1 Tax=Lipomyces oligophaga TaxID=45792 RepID=UPI0034CDEDA5
MDTTSHFSDDSFVLPKLSSYALALLSADGDPATAEHHDTEKASSERKEGQELGKPSSSAVSGRSLSRAGHAALNTLPKSQVGGSTAHDHTRFGSSHSSTAYPTSAHKAHQSSPIESEEINSRISPKEDSATTPYHRRNQLHEETRSVAGEGLLTTPAPPTWRSHGSSDLPTSQYRTSLFWKSRFGKLGPPKRTVRRESQEGVDLEGAPKNLSISPLPGADGPSSIDIDGLVQQDLLLSPKEHHQERPPGKLRFAEQPEEIPPHHSKSSPFSGSEKIYDKLHFSDSLDSRQRRSSSQSIPTTEFSQLEVDYKTSSSTKFRSSSLQDDKSAAGSEYSENDRKSESDIDHVTDQKPYAQPMTPYEAATRELTALRHTNSPVSMRQSPHSSGEHKQHRSMLSPQSVSNSVKPQRHVVTSVFRDNEQGKENLWSHQNIMQPGSHNHSNLHMHSLQQGRQLLTPLSANIRPLRTSTPPQDCATYDPPPKMSNLDIPRPTPKVSNKKPRNSVTVAGKTYQRLELIGKGGSSKVFKVQLAHSTKIYAMKKVTLDEVDDSVISGFKGEIELLRQLSDEKRVVRLVDFEIRDLSVNMVMECGEIDLAHVLAERLNLPLDISFVRYHTIEMLKCVEAVHRHGIVHSDLKPANFLFVRGYLKIIDFGIANAVPEYTCNVRRDTQIGTPNYMAPETLLDVSSVEGKKLLKVGRPSDVWSCGCIIYQMIYGRPPYAIYNGTQRMLAIMDPKVKVSYPDLGLGNVPVPQEAISAMAYCLERDPEQRGTIQQIMETRFLQPLELSREVLLELLKSGVSSASQTTSDIEHLANVWCSRLGI